MTESDDEEATQASIESFRKEKWRIHGEEVEEEDDDEDRCMGCFELSEKVDDLKFQLQAEVRAADETIIMVQNMEKDHQRLLDLAAAKLNLEKDRVVELSTTLDFERKARMQEMYKAERNSLDFDHSMKEFKNLNSKNSNLGEEYDAIQNENATLVQLTEQLQQNKIDILEQLKIYENDITDLERNNDTLRQRLYDSDNEKDRYKVLAARLKQKLQDKTTGRGERTKLKLEAAKNKTLGPLQSYSKRSSRNINYFSRAEGDSVFASASVSAKLGKKRTGMSHLTQQLSQQSPTQQAHYQDSGRNTNRSGIGDGGGGGVPELTSSMFAETRLRSSQTASDLSSVNYIRSFNADPRTVSNSKKKNPMLWPVQY